MPRRSPIAFWGFLLVTTLLAAACGGRDDADTEAAEGAVDPSGTVSEPETPALPLETTGTITLLAFTCGDNCYLDYETEDGTEETAICRIGPCEEWQQGSALLPSALRGTRATATFTTAAQTDASGNVMDLDFPAISDMALLTSAAEPEVSAQGAMPGTEGPLPLQTGVYIREGSPCDDPANAAIRFYDGNGLSGSATRDCRATVQSENNSRHVIENDCENTYDGSRSTETLTLAIASDTRFALDGGPADPVVYRLCPELTLADLDAE